MLAVGFDPQGQAIWHEWGEPHLAEWYRPQGWLDRRHAHLLTHVARALFERWRDPCWQEVLWRVLGMYAEANKAGGRQSPFVESRLLGAVAALELLAWVILAGGCGDPPADARFVDARPEAHKPLGRLVEHAGLPTAIPDTMRDLKAAARANNWQGAHKALIELRNRIAHPRRRDDGHIGVKPSGALADAWVLAMWWLDLVLLNLLGYTDQYADRRIRGRRVGQVEPVPWAVGADNE